MTTGDMLWVEIVLRHPEFESMSDEELILVLQQRQFPDSIIVEVLKARTRLG